MKLTADDLKRMGACEEQVDLYRKLHPKGLALTLGNLEKCALEGLQLHWLIRVADLRHHDLWCEIHALRTSLWVDLLPNQFTMACELALITFWDEFVQVLEEEIRYVRA